MGALAGWFMLVKGSRFARRTRANLSASHIAPDPEAFHRLLRQSMIETGKSTLETFAIWLQPQRRILHWVRGCRGWEHVEAAWRDNKSIIFLTPHLGCYEITAQYYAAQRPISVLYRPPRASWLSPLIEEGRERGNIRLAPANLKGVRELLKSLKQKEAVGILPDQRPGKGEGEWVDFFGRPAYTMTLVDRLARSTGATILMAFGERLPWGRGFVIHIEPYTSSPDPQAMNQAIEQLIKREPAQYLWSYPRHKPPRGIAPPP